MKRKMFARTLIPITLILGLLVVTGCKRETSSDTYDTQHFGKAVSTYPGIVKSVREVTVTNEKGWQDNTTGLLGGAVAGALIGSTIGRGTGTVVAAVVGGVGGAAGGAGLEQYLKTEKGLEYTVELDNGQIKTIVQGMKPRLFEGQRVYVMMSEKGRSRVVSKPVN